MTTKQVENTEKWDEEIAQNNEAYFLQTVSWGEHEKADGKQVFYLDLLKDDNVIAKGLFAERPLPFGKKYLYCPMGPMVLRAGNIELRAEIAKFCKEKGYVFARVEMISEGINPKILVKQTSPKTSLYLDLNKSEEQLLSEMKQKTRYNIRLAEKRGVKVKLSKDEKDLTAFYEILKETAKRDGIGIYKKEHYKIMLDGGLDLWVAEAGGVILAGTIVGSFNKIAVYLHGGSSNNMRNLMAPYLLQWEAIKHYKDKGFSFYDFWGVAVKSEKRKAQNEKLEYEVDESHAWAGITKFKLGFGGEIKEFPGAKDIVASNFWYNLFALLTKIKRLIKI